MDSTFLRCTVIFLGRLSLHLLLRVEVRLKMHVTKLSISQQGEKSSAGENGLKLR